jgi:hypothetical protein
MKANELRVGNLFWFTDFHARKERVICGADIAYAEKEPDWLDAFWTPITLTEERLLRFGFESNSYQDRYENNVIHIECNKTRGFTELWIERMPHIKYVHQLQNLYFALTGQELELKP